MCIGNVILVDEVCVLPVIVADVPAVVIVLPLAAGGVEQLVAALRAVAVDDEWVGVDFEGLYALSS